MKQVIIRIRDVDGKLRNKFYYSNVSQFNTYAYKDIEESNFMSGYELDIKVGNQYRVYRVYEDLCDSAKENGTDIYDEIYRLVYGYDLQYYIKEYLPRY